MKKIMFAAALATSFGVYAAGNGDITGAFGIKFGETLSKSLVQPMQADKIAYETPKHAMRWISVNPPKSAGVFENYEVKTTPTTDKVYLIYAETIVNNRCDKMAKPILSVLEDKYGKAKQVPEPYGGFAYVIEKGQTEVVMQCSDVLSVSYIDLTLEKQAMDEQAKIDEKMQKEKQGKIDKSAF